jgi:phytoene synthase
MAEQRVPGRGGPDDAIRRGSKSFAMAARGFDPRTRALVEDLYAWCRHCDDVVDGQVLGHGRGTRRADADGLASLRRDTAAAMAGQADPASPFGALGRVVAATGLPPVLVDDHLDGFAMDVAGRRYETRADLIAYCYGVAGSVGLMMAWIMGVRDAAVLCRASDLGVAFQLSNIARDVADDLEVGRVYLPGEWLADAGVTLVPGRSWDPSIAAGVAGVVTRVLAEAERYYASARHGIGVLPLRSAWAVATARLVYRAMGRRVAARGAEAWTTRTAIGTPRLAAGLVLGGGHALWLAAMATRRQPPARTGLFTPAAIAVLR